MTSLHDFTAVEQRDLLQAGELKPADLVSHYLDRIGEWNDTLGALITVDAETAIRRASNPKGLPRGGLWGLPYAEKDLWDRAGVVTTYGSRRYETHRPTASGELVQVLDDAGGISVGRTNTSEFGFSCYTENAVGPTSRCPYDLTCGPGGSSGGAAAAVAAGLIPVAPASDGGGSIRIPAAVNGLVGIKPSRGRVPAGAGFGLGGLSVPGPIARTVGDAAMLLDVLAAGGSYEFATRSPGGLGPFLSSVVPGGRQFRIGVTTTSPWDTAYDLHLDSDATDALEVGINALASADHQVEEFAFGPAPEYPSAFRTIWQASAAGLDVEGAQLELLEPLTRWLVQEGRRLSARDLAGALGALVEYERRTIRSMSGFDAILTPALAQSPRPLGWFSTNDPEVNFEQQCRYTPFTSFANACGLPAISLPVHMTADGLPMGVQLVGQPGGENTLIAIGADLELRLRWHVAHPPQW